MLVGLACLAVNLGQPLVRNGLVYARAAEHVIEHGFDPFAVVADSRLSYDKPVGFAWIASPLVAWLGTHVGLMLVSAAGTIAYLASVRAFAVSFGSLALSEGERALVLLFAGLGPIVAYQFWSAHPDSLFAALYLAAFVLARRIARAPSGGLVGLFFAVVFASLVLKNYGLILIPSAGLYFVLERRSILGAPHGRRHALWIVLALLALGTLVILGRTGHNPLMRIEGEGGGAGQYGQGQLWLAAGGTLVAVGIALLVNVHCALPLVCLPAAWRAARGSGLLRALLCFVLPYIAGLMLFPTSFYNMRYFVPLLPFAALLAVLELRSVSATWKRVYVASFTLVALVLVAVFDFAPVYRFARPAIPKLEVNWIGVPLDLLDNLRLPKHLEARAWIDNINRQVERDGLVYMLDVFYYGDAQQGVYERAGQIRKDIRTSYISSRHLGPETLLGYVWGARIAPAALERFGKVRDLGAGLYFVEPR